MPTALKRFWAAVCPTAVTVEAATNTVSNAEICHRLAHDRPNVSREVEEQKCLTFIFAPVVSVFGVWVVLCFMTNFLALHAFKYLLKSLLCTCIHSAYFCRNTTIASIPCPRAELHIKEALGNQLCAVANNSNTKAQALLGSAFGMAARE
jgi:hypothetical protein